MFYPNLLPKEISGQRVVYFKPVSINNVSARNLPSSVQADLELVRSAEIIPTTSFLTKSRKYYNPDDEIPSITASSSQDVGQIKPVEENTQKIPPKSSDRDLVATPSQVEAQALLDSNSEYWYLDKTRHRDSEKMRRIKEKALFKRLDTVLGKGKNHKVIILHEAASVIKTETAKEESLSDDKETLSRELLSKLTLLVEKDSDRELQCTGHTFTGIRLSDLLKYNMELYTADPGSILKVVQNLCFTCLRVYVEKTKKGEEESPADLNSESEDKSVTKTINEDVSSEAESLNQSAPSRRLSVSSVESLSSPLSPSTVDEDLSDGEQTEEVGSLDESSKQRIAMLDEAEKGLNIDDVFAALNAVRT